MQFGSARPYNLTNSYNTLNTGGGTATAVLVPTNAMRNYQFGPNYITAFIPAYVQANCPTTPDDPTCLANANAQAQQNLQMCFY